MKGYLGMLDTQERTPGSQPEWEEADSWSYGFSSVLSMSCPPSAPPTEGHDRSCKLANAGGKGPFALHRGQHEDIRTRAPGAPRLCGTAGPCQVG